MTQSNNKCEVCGICIDSNTKKLCQHCEDEDMTPNLKLPPKPIRIPRIIAVDFDGTLCRDEFPSIGEPIDNTICLIRQLKKEGNLIILWTCRVNDRLQEAVEWCKNRDLEFDAVNGNVASNVNEYGTDPRKVFAHLYIDDKSVSKVQTFYDVHVIREMLEDSIK